VFDIRRTQPNLDAGVAKKPGHEPYPERNSICGQAGRQVGGLGTGTEIHH